MHVLRAAPALTMVIHGTFRIADGGVTGFGDFLATQHVPAAHAVAWLLTIVEVFGGLTLAAGFAVVPLCLWFIAEHAVGMLTVHLPSGWFVVGGGRNGMEYSALLVVCFVVTAMLAPVVRANRLVPPPAG
jgi:putative oxidoreductase